MHCRMMQLCFMRPGPPNFFMSLQKWHSPHSVRRQASHLRHRVRRLRAPAVVRLAANFTAEAGPNLPLGRPTTRLWSRTDGTSETGGLRGGQAELCTYARDAADLPTLGPQKATPIGWGCGNSVKGGQVKVKGSSSMTGSLLLGDTWIQGDVLYD